MNDHAKLPTIGKAAAGVAAAAAILAPTMAGADAGTKDPVRRSSADQAKVRASGRPATDAKSPERVDSYLEEMSRAGRRYRTAELREYTVPDEIVGEITIVAPVGYEPVATETAALDEGGARRRGFGTAMTQTGPAVEGRASAGFGYEGGVNPQNMTYKSGNCVTAFFNPQYSHTSDHRLSTCWEKWKSNSEHRWIYNRWAWFTRGAPSGRYAGTLDFTIRSRAWRGYESRITSMTGHTPALGNNNCSQTAGFTLSAPGISLTIPIHRCSSTSSLEHFGNRSGGIDWNGQTAGQLFLDFGMAVTSDGNEPVWADYAWMEVCDSLTSSTCPANPSQYLLRKDSGW